MHPQVPTIKRDGRSAVVNLRGDLTVARVASLYATLRGVGKQRGVKTLVLDFSECGRIDSSGIAVLALLGRQLGRQHKKLDLVRLHDQHRAALALAPETGAYDAENRRETPADPPQVDSVGEIPRSDRTVSVRLSVLVEQLGERVIDFGANVAAFAQLVTDTVRQLVQVVARGKRMPAGALRQHLDVMGVGAIFIVSLLSFLTGMTMAFQGAVQLARFGAGVFVADMIGMSMVRELVPLMTAVIITGRTGAAIAAELGTMQVRSEIDALSTMGIDPVRFLVVPRIVAITVAGPALTLIGIFVGILGGMLVAAVTLDMPAVTFWARVVDRVTLLDFVHGLGKSVVFAWIIGFAGSHLGMRAGGDASSVGTATTRTVVTSVFFIILVDAVFATIATFAKHG
jgi:phospholipid/cholesterol/gamma-HCH transport system permease protein